jgi:hypothetical protein
VPSAYGLVVFNLRNLWIFTRRILSTPDTHFFLKASISV